MTNSVEKKCRQSAGEIAKENFVCAFLVVASANRESLIRALSVAVLKRCYRRLATKGGLVSSSSGFLRLLQNTKAEPLGGSSEELTNPRRFPAGKQAL